MIGTRTNVPVEYVSTHDPALDTAHSDWDFTRYMQTFDRKFMPCKAGSTPTVFTLRRLSRRRFTAIAGMAKHEQAETTIAYGVAGIANFMDGRGNAVIPEFDGAGQDQRLTAVTLDALFSPALFAELAQVILLLTDLDPLADGRSGLCPG